MVVCMKKVDREYKQRLRGGVFCSNSNFIEHVLGKFSSLYIHTYALTKHECFPLCLANLKKSERSFETYCLLTMHVV